MSTVSPSTLDSPHVCSTRLETHHDVVAYDYQEAREVPALTYSGTSSPASSAGGSPQSSPAAPQSMEVEPESPKPSPKAKSHIPRPSNAFIIFRSHFYTKVKSTQKGINQNELSRAAAAVWRGLPEEEKKTFQKKAAKAKVDHYEKHPGYVYAPVNKSLKRAQKTKAADSPAKQPPVKKQRSTLSQRSVKATKPVAPEPKLRSSSRLSTLRVSPPSESDCSSSGSPVFVPLDQIPPLDLSQFKKMLEGDKKEDGSLNRVDYQFGCRPEEGHTTTLPPVPSENVVAGCPNGSVASAISDSSDHLVYSTGGYPSWMYNELIGSGTPDTGLHADWNPLQTTLDAYGDVDLDNTTNNHYREFSQFVNYDNVDTAGADGAPAGYPFLNSDGAWIGLQ